MLAIGRALMAHPRLLLLDEPSLGLAPVLVEEVFATIRDINERGNTRLAPFHRAARTSPPAATNRWTSPASPFAAASVTGVSPYSSAVLTLAPESSSASAMRRSPRWIAHANAVDPSGCAAFTSALARSKAANAF